MNGVTDLRDPPFKILIVGAGISGLILAYSLDKAGIDYVVLDKYEVAPAWGGAIFIHNHGARILDQLGLLEDVTANCAEMRNFWNRGPDGKTFLVEPFLSMVNERTGYVGFTLERRELLKILWEKFPSKPKIVEHARVSQITEAGSRVKVTLTDGKIHEGDMVVGCDGVHSIVRERMWETAHKSSPGLITAQEKQRMRTTYECLTGFAPHMSGLGNEDLTSVSNDKYSFLLLSQPDKIYFNVHCKLPNNKMVTYPTRLRYTDGDAEAKATELAQCPVSDTLVFGDIWKNRTRGQIVSLEEGVLTKWYYGRTVLCGDAAHKLSPTSALGANTAMESAVELANEIYSMVNRHTNMKPRDEEIRLCLQRYQETRIPRVTALFNVSYTVMRMHTYDGWHMYILQRWLLPIIGYARIADQAAKTCVEAPKLSYVPFREQSGTLPWVKHKWESQLIEGKPELGGSYNNAIVTPVAWATFALYFILLLGFGSFGKTQTPAVGNFTSHV